MKEIIIKNQKEWDDLDKDFKELTRVVFQDAEIKELTKAYDNCEIVLKGTSRIGSMNGSSRVVYMNGSSRIDYMYDSSSVGYMYGSSRIDYMYDSSSVGYMYGSSSVDYMNGSSSVGYMYGSSSVGYMYGSSSVGSMYGLSRIDYMYDSSSVDYMNGSSSVGYMYDSSSVGYMYDSSSVGFIGVSSKINKAFDGAVIYTNELNRIGFADKGVTIKRVDIGSSFETMIEHGVLRADGITKAIKRVKKVSDTEKVYFLEDDTFCAQKDMTFAHAKSLKMALFDLRFKLSDRDMSDYKGLALDDKLSFEDAVTCYRVITGACSGGVEDFLERKSINKNEFTIGEIIDLTKGEYAGSTFARFFGALI